MSTNRPRIPGVFPGSCLAFIFLATFRLSSCYNPPPMVRMYDYDIPQDEVLPKCQEALIRLEYGIDLYAPLDHHLITEEFVIKKFLRKVHYVVHVKVEDRIAVYLYSEARTFKRASEMGIRAGELTEVGTTQNLGIRFQDEIFTPITKELEKRGFLIWDPIKDSQRDDREIRYQGEEQRRRLAQHRRKATRERIDRETRSGEYSEERDVDRFDAVSEAEHYVMNLQDSPDTPKLGGWSLINISKTVAANHNHLKSVMAEILDRYRSYSGHGEIMWIVEPDGRVQQVNVLIDSSPHTPDHEISNGISSTFRKMVFLPTGKRSGYLVLTMELEFSGSYHNLRYHFSRPRIAALLQQVPVPIEETVSDTFFDLNPVRDR